MSVIQEDKTQDPKYKHDNCNMIYVAQNLERRIEKLEARDERVTIMDQQINLLTHDLQNIRESIKKLSSSTEDLIDTFESNKKWFLGVVVTLIISLIGGWMGIFNLVDKKFTDTMEVIHKIDTQQQLQIEREKLNAKMSDYYDNKEAE